MATGSKQPSLYVSGSYSFDEHFQRESFQLRVSTKKYEADWLEVTPKAAEGVWFHSSRGILESVKPVLGSEEEDHESEPMFVSMDQIFCSAKTHNLDDSDDLIECELEDCDICFPEEEEVKEDATPTRSAINLQKTCATQPSASFSIKEMDPPILDRFFDVVHNVIRILVTETEPNGHTLAQCRLSVLEVDAKLETAHEQLLFAAATFPALYHRGPHSGVAAEYLSNKLKKPIKLLREGIDHTEEEEDALLEHEVKKCDFRIHAVCVDPENSELEEDLDTFIEHVQDELNKKRAPDPDSDGSVHPDRERKGHLEEGGPRWDAFRTFWLQDKAAAAACFYPTLASKLKPYYVDVDAECHEDDQDDEEIQCIQAPVFHCYWTDDRSGDYEGIKDDGFAPPEKQAKWLALLKVKPESIRMDEGENYPPTKHMEWTWEDHESSGFCYDVYSLVRIFFRKVPCPAVGTKWTCLLSAKEEKRRKRDRFPDVVREISIEQDGVYCEGARLCTLEDWSSLCVLPLTHIQV